MSAPTVTVVFTQAEAAAVRRLLDREVARGWTPERLKRARRAVRAAVAEAHT